MDQRWSSAAKITAVGSDILLMVLSSTETGFLKTCPFRLITSLVNTAFLNSVKNWSVSRALSVKLSTCGATIKIASWLMPVSDFTRRRSSRRQADLARSAKCSSSVLLFLFTEYPTRSFVLLPLARFYRRLIVLCCRLQKGPMSSDQCSLQIPDHQKQLSSADRRTNALAAARGTTPLPASEVRSSPPAPL